MMATFSTIISGVIVFILGEYILKLIILPVNELKMVIAQIQSLCLRNTSAINSTIENPEMANQFYDVSTNLLIKSQSITFYKYSRYGLDLPSENDLLEVSKRLNMIGGFLMRSSENDWEYKQKAVQEIANLLSKKCTFEK